MFVLGLKALWRERNVLVFTSTALAAVLGPLLLLYGFKFGVIGGLLAALRDDPSNREILLRGNYSITAADIERYRAMPEVAFVLPSTRTIAARLEFATSEATVPAAVYPTGPGDPLLPAGLVIAEGQVALSPAVAARLRVKVGDRLKGQNRRLDAGGHQQIEFDLLVAHIIDRRYVTGDRAYVMPSLLFALEAFLDGYELPERGLPGKPLSGHVQVAANVRMYARSIEDVPMLDQRLAAAGYGVSSKADDVAGILALNQNLASAFSLIAAVGTLGYAVSLFSSLVGSVARQRKFLSLVRLMGARRSTILLFPLAQGIVIASTGFLLAVVLYAVVAGIANLRFAAPAGTELCRLEAGHIAAAFGGTLLVVGAVVGWVSSRLFAVTPAEVLHAE